MPVTIADKGKDCPLWKKDVSEVCHKCPWWTKVKGKDPQSHEDVENWACAIAWVPTMGLAAIQASHQVSADLNSFRNEMVKSNGMSQRIMLQAAAANLLNKKGER